MTATKISVSRTTLSTMDRILLWDSQIMNERLFFHMMCTGSPEYCRSVLERLMNSLSTLLAKLRQILKAMEVKIL